MKKSNVLLTLTIFILSLTYSLDVVSSQSTTNDDCPDSEGNSTNDRFGCKDSDGDGLADKDEINV